MAASNLDVAQNVVSLTGGGDKGKKIVPATQDANQKFGNWTGQTDTKVMAQDLKKRGLVNADQLVEDNPNPDDPNSVRNSQSDWKVSAIQQILANAKKFNLRTPEEIAANKHVLIGNGKWSDAIENPTFSQIHPNWWNVISKSILPEQWAKYDAANKDNIANK